MPGFGFGFPLAGRGGGGVAYDFTGGALPAGASFARASAAMRCDASGVLVNEGVDTPRFDHDPASHAPRGLLIEPAATNLVPRAQAFDHAAWVKNGATGIADTATAPDGATSADLICEDATTDVHALQNPTIALAAGSYTYSLYAKAGARSRFMLYSLADGSCRGFDVASGTSFAVTGFTDAADYAIEDAGGGWYRCRVTLAFAGGTGPSAAVYLISTGSAYSYAGDGASGVEVWQAQLEAGAMTSPIATTSAAATRAADLLTLAGPSATWRFTFDDGSHQDVSLTASGGVVSVPTSLDRARIVRAAPL